MNIAFSKKKTLVKSLQIHPTKHLSLYTTPSPTYTTVHKYTYTHIHTVNCITHYSQINTTNVKYSNITVICKSTLNLTNTSQTVRIREDTQTYN